jgi:hypothetical protein
MTNPTWHEVDRDLNALAREAGIPSQREVDFHEELDRLAEVGLPIPTEAKALAWEER